MLHLFARTIFVKLSICKGNNNLRMKCYGRVQRNNYHNYCCVREELFPFISSNHFQTDLTSMQLPLTSPTKPSERSDLRHPTPRTQSILQIMSRIQISLNKLRFGKLSLHLTCRTIIYPLMSNCGSSNSLGAIHCFCFD